jgi:hypothetical protein
MAPKKRTGPPTAFDAPPVLTGKRKRATVSYVDVEGEIDATSKDEDLKPVEEIITSDSDEDADFGISHKVCQYSRLSYSACTTDASYRQHRRRRRRRRRQPSQRARRMSSGSVSWICRQSFVT